MGKEIYFNPKCGGKFAVWNTTVDRFEVVGSKSELLDYAVQNAHSHASMMEASGLPYQKVSDEQIRAIWRKQMKEARANPKETLSSMICTVTDEVLQPSESLKAGIIVSGGNIKLCGMSATPIPCNMTELKRVNCVLDEGY